MNVTETDFNRSLMYVMEPTNIRYNHYVLPDSNSYINKI